MAEKLVISSSVKSGGSERSEVDCWLLEGRPHVEVAIAGEPPAGRMRDPAKRLFACEAGRWDGTSSERQKRTDDA